MLACFYDFDKLKLYFQNATPNPTVRYNKAIVYYHRHMYNAAISSLQPLIEKLDSIEPSLAADVGLLMLHLLLATQQLQKAQSFLEYIKTKLGLGNEVLSSDDNTALDVFNRAFKLLSLLTNVLNKRVVSIPDDGVCH